MKLVHHKMIQSMLTKIMKWKWSEIAIHVVVWLILVSVPLLLQFGDEKIHFRFMKNVWLMLLDIAIVFYVNYLFAIDKLFYSKRVFFFVLFNIALVFFIYFLDSVAYGLLDYNDGKHRRLPGGVQTIFLYNKFIFVVLGFGAAMAVKYYGRLVLSERAREKLEREKLTSEISLLKYQIQPHFFFNTLNNIYSLIAKSPTDAQKAVHSLSKMMRYVLYDNRSTEIPLEKEVEFIQNYDKLMRLRLGERVTVTLEVSDNMIGVNIPPLLLIPLLENAYKHGVSATVPSFIACSVRVEDGYLFFEVINTLFEKVKEDRSDSGIGLSNLRKRLEIQYGKAYFFNAEPNDKGEFVATLKIPIIVR